MKMTPQNNGNTTLTINITELRQLIDGLEDRKSDLLKTAALYSIPAPKKELMALATQCDSMVYQLKRRLAFAKQEV